MVKGFTNWRDRERIPDPAGRADHNFCLWALVSLLAWQQRHAADISVAIEA
jgi:hypothetical protein